MASSHRIIIFLIVIWTLLFVSAAPLKPAGQVRQPAPQAVITPLIVRRLVQRCDHVTRLKAREPGNRQSAASVCPIQYSICLVLHDLQGRVNVCPIPCSI